MAKPALVVMAAGIGSRYGGLKQIDPIGPNGEIIIDYSIYDALKAGFGKIVFIIKKEIEEVFREKVGRRVEKIVDTAYVLQSITDIPPGFQVPAGRLKPWGTGHAVLSCKNEVSTPFAVINADDFYGRSSFQLLYDYLKSIKDSDEMYRYYMVGFNIENTLTEHGHVARGLCSVDANGYLRRIKEYTRIEKVGNLAKYTEDGINWVEIPRGSIVSMNIWGFTPSIFKELEARFPVFLEENKKNLLKAEYFLPDIVGSLLAEGRAEVKVLPTKESWYGVTYKEDKLQVREAINHFIENGIYPENLLDC